ncbi:hypothetical protein [Clostridium perfringens]|uniref:hypothetical protein n=1 Tax=Clostridium perfringens TaxID=1502 RepID=UPI0024BC3F98|nr:hypothetical protein [Clostridium perfringens]EGT5618323.1 hypothetical protein [Clostridium perfringens]
MFGTTIIDAYTKDEVHEIANALDDLCSPKDNFGWASAGIYCFWDYYTKEIYYIGLALDLTERFKQHNGLMKIDEKCCKKKYINEYFKNKEKLGYTIFVQSPMSQPITHRNKKGFEEWLSQGFSKEDYVGQEGHNFIKRVEGMLLEAYKKVNGDYPKWNKIGGSKLGQKAATEGNYEIIKSFNQVDSHALVAKSTLRELSNNSKYELYEIFLHSIRMKMLNFKVCFNESLNMHNNTDSYGWWEKITKDGYQEKKLII